MCIHNAYKTTNTFILLIRGALYVNRTFFKAASFKGPFEVLVLNWDTASALEGLSLLSSDCTKKLWM